MTPAMRLEEVADVMRVSPKSILNGLANGTFLPLPIDRKPYRWNPEHIDAWKRGEYVAALAKLRQARKAQA